MDDASCAGYCIGFGIVLLAGIYLWGRRGRAPVAPQDAVVRAAPEPDRFGADRDRNHVWGRRATGSASFSGASCARSRAVPPTISERAADHSAATAAAATHAAPTRQRPTRTWRLRGRRPRRSRRSSRRASWPTSTSCRYMPSARSPRPVCSRTPEPTDQAPTLSMSRRRRRGASSGARSSRCAWPHRPQRYRRVRSCCEALEAESLQYGKYEVFHRLHDDGASVFSVASMVEPGTFDLERMAGHAVIPASRCLRSCPGPLPGCRRSTSWSPARRRLQQTLGGTLQDERGVPLTVHRIERLRQEIARIRASAASARRAAAPIRSPDGKP